MTLPPPDPLRRSPHRMEVLAGSLIANPIDTLPVKRGWKWFVFDGVRESFGREVLWFMFVGERTHVQSTLEPQPPAEE